jgi:hypothetical protein
MSEPSSILRSAVDLIRKAEGDNIELKLHKTASDTYRVLINGKVHPLFVGFLTPESAIKKPTNNG